MGHKTDRVFHNYFSSVPRLDIDSYIMRREADQHFMDFVTSGAFRYDHRAPKPPGSLIVELDQSLVKVSEDNIQQAFKDPGRLKTTRKGAAQFARKHKYLQRRRQWFEEAPRRDLAILENGTAQVKPEAQQSRYLDIWLKYDTNRKAVINSLFENPTTWHNALKYLIKEALPSARHFYYPWAEDAEFELGFPLWPKRKADNHGLQPTDIPDYTNDVKSIYDCMYHDKLPGTHCQWNGCAISLKEMDYKSIQKHIKAHFVPKKTWCQWKICKERRPESRIVQGSSPSSTSDVLSSHFQQMHAFPPSFFSPRYPSFCFECREWLYGQDNWDKHSMCHLQSLDMFCGIAKRDKLVIIAGKCPFCLGSPELLPHKRYIQFHTGAKLNQHLNKHFANDDWKERENYPRKCPHPECFDNIESSEELREHFNCNHGIRSIS
jgi:hypothetical protein